MIAYILREDDVKKEKKKAIDIDIYKGRKL